MTDRRIAAVATRQHGLVTRQQALAAGLTADQIKSRIGTGRWLLVRRGVYAVAGVPPSREQAVLAAVLAAGHGAIASHLTAGLLWRLPLPAPAAIDVVTGPGPLARLEGVRHHRTGTLHRHDVTVVDGIPVTSPARTIVDCSGSVRLGRLEEVVDDAERRRLLRIDDLTSCVDRAATGPGRRPTLQIRAVLSDRLPVGDSVAEKNLVQWLVAAGTPVPVLGHEVIVRGRRYKLDVAWPWALTALEFDSWAFHSTFRSFHRDRDRVRRLRAASWDIWPVTSKTDLDELVADLLPHLSARSEALVAFDRAQSA